MTRGRRWLIAGTIGLIITSAAAALVVHRAMRTVRPDILKTRVEQEISDRLHLDATIGALSVTLYPRAGITGRRLELRVPNHPELPPFVSIDKFSVSATPRRLLHDIQTNHVELVSVEGLVISVPAGQAKNGLVARSSADDASSPVVVDRLTTKDAELRILRAKPGQRPLVFHLHELDMTGLGFERPIAFHATLTNPVPRGEVISDGTVGPWQSDPSDLPLAGTYTFRHADLDTIRGIGGMLTSDGRYSGSVSKIRVVGTSNTPDFNLDFGGRPVPLSTQFTAVVDGANGTTHLESVDATLFRTQVHVTGDVVNLPGPAGFDIRLQAAVRGGRIEDILRLALDGRPPFSGAMLLSASIRVPAGETPVRDRLELNGRFGLQQVTFTDGDVERKLTELSRRGQGKDPDAPAAPAVSNFLGDFQLANGRMELEDLAFTLPGAAVELSGTYRLPTQTMAFEGQLRTEAVLSNVVGGFKSLFIKPFDWMFKHGGTGAVIPIAISGTREHPKFSVRMGAMLPK